MISSFQKIINKSKLFIRNINAPPVIVLLYHRVAELNDDPLLLAVSPDNFRKQVRFLAKHFPVLRFEDSWKNIRTSFVITFDDGYRDNYLNALPILEEYGVPATFFITSENVRSQRNFWWDDLAFLTKDKDSFSKHLQELKKYDAKTRDRHLNNLFLAYGEKTEEFPCHVLSESELKEFAASKLVTIGSHTRNHCQLSSLSYEQQYTEIQEGHQALANMLGKNPEVFSYPFGTLEDYNSDSIRICRELNFKKVASNFSHTWHPGDSEFELPRTLVRNWSLPRFQYELFKSFMR